MLQAETTMDWVDTRITAVSDMGSIPPRSRASSATLLQNTTIIIGMRRISGVETKWGRKFEGSRRAWFQEMMLVQDCPG